MGNHMSKFIAKFQTKISERGATAVEYGLMVALIAIVIIVAVALGGNCRVCSTRWPAGDEAFGADTGSAPPEGLAAVRALAGLRD